MEKKRNNYGSKKKMRKHQFELREAKRKQRLEQQKKLSEATTVDELAEAMGYPIK